ncbi:MAG TPA: S9 family peptidase [Pyrinomonadaceae bacterium]|jgi:dipeptidyl aminopeptidase/acylaminoacyl peptidase|nr:S9 family peptidase [Pyrinomonadaceae bacterium]
MKRVVSILTVLLIGLCSFAAAQNRTYTVEDLLKVRRVGDPQVSPDGKRVAFTVGDVNFDGNRVVNQIYTTSIDGGGMKQLTSGDRSSSAPRWSPDGKKIAYTTGSQLWVMDNDGDHKEQVTKISTGAAAPVWSPDGKWIAFTSDVYPDCDNDDCNKKRDEQAESSKVKAHIITRLLYKHWDEWRDMKRTHVFVVASKGGTARDLTTGDFDSPPYAAASGVDYAFSPDSSEIAFLRNPDKVEATSTNSDIYVMPVAGGPAKNITVLNHGYDAGPVYTHDGKFILYRSQATAGFEADRWRLMAYNRATGTSVELTRGFDQQVDEVVVSPEGNTIYFTAGDRGKSPIFRIPIGGGVPQKVLGTVFAGSVRLTPDGRTFVFSSSSLSSPTEIYRANADGSGVTALTSVNGDLMQRANLKTAEEIEWTGALGRKVHGYIVKPNNFDASKKYPLVVLIHGGPQSAWNDNWGYRWNPQVFANAGYVVFTPNPRGSTGYGQQFVNEISGDWGGKVFVDLMNGVADVLRRSPYIDRNRIGAAGASYGGYMINWILGHNNDPRFHFKVLVSHDGVYNLESMYGATEELWFPEWEFKGTPWTNPALYTRWSPHKFAQNFNTPILIIHSELDFRVPLGEGMQLFTAVQRKGIDSKFLTFPDEGHWVLKPQNSQLWYHTVLDWLDKYLQQSRTDTESRR